MPKSKKSLGAAVSINQTNVSLVALWSVHSRLRLAVQLANCCRLVGRQLRMILVLGTVQVREAAEHSRRVSSTTKLQSSTSARHVIWQVVLPRPAFHVHGLVGDSCQLEQRRCQMVGVSRM